MKSLDIALVASGQQPLDPQGKEIIKQVTADTIDSVVDLYNVTGKFEKK